MLSLPVLHHAQGLQRAHNVVRVDGHLLIVAMITLKRHKNHPPPSQIIRCSVSFTHLRQVFNVQVRARPGAQIVQKYVLPVRPVRDQSQVGQRFLGGSDFALGSGE